MFLARRNFTFCLLILTFMLLCVEKVNAAAIACNANETAQTFTFGGANAWTGGSSTNNYTVGTAPNAVTLTFTNTQVATPISGDPSLRQSGNNNNALVVSGINASVGTTLSTLALTTNRTINKLSFNVYDMDYSASGASNFRDRIVATINAGTFPTAMTAVTPANETITLASGNASATNSANCAATDTGCNIEVQFNTTGISSSSTQFRTDHASGTTVQQSIGFGEYAWCLPKTTLTLRKVWVNAKVNDAVTVTATGLTSLSAVANTTSETDTGIAQGVTPGSAITIGETFTTGSSANYTSVLTCTGNATALAGNVLTVNAADTAIVCTQTNTRIAQQLNLVKQWTNGVNNHTASVTTTGGTANPTVSSTATGGSSSTTGTAVTVYAGDVVTLPAETFGGGAVAGQYNTTLVCTGGSPLASGAVARNITIANSATATTCTYTNSRIAQQLNLVKQWTNGVNNHTASVTTTGGTANPTVSSTATGGSSSTTGTAVTVYAGDVVTLPAETFGGGAVAGQYNTTLVCTGGSPLASGAVARNVTIANSATATTCTYTNSRIAQQLNLVKQWTNGVNNHTASVTTTGGTANPTVSSTATGGSSSTTGTAVTVYAGDVVTLPAETFGGGAIAGNYTSTVACTGGSTLASGAVARNVTIANSATATTCTYTNSRIAQQLNLVKQWTNGVNNHTASVTTTGGTANPTVNSTATGGSSSTTGTAVTVYAGDVVTLPAETFGGGAIAGNYTSTVACTGGSTLASGAVARNVTIAGSATATTCTYTNSRIAQQLNLVKQWTNGVNNHTASVTTTGGTANPTVSSTATGGSSSTTGTAVTVYAGDVVTLPAETFGGGAIAGNYTSTVACSGGSTLASGAVARNVTIAGSATATTCTYTNSRISQGITLTKSWTNGKTSDAVSLTITGATGAVAGSAIVGGATTAATATGFAGSTISFAEGFTVGSASNYNSTLSCVKNSDSSVVTVTTNSITMPSDSAVTCTFNNSRIAQSLTLEKQWTNGVNGHTATVTTTGGTNNPTVSSTSTGNNLTTGTALTVYAGDVVTLPAETFGGGAIAGNYTSTLVCTGGTTLASGAVARNITINSSGTATTCTYTNSRKTATLTLRKIWVNAQLNDALNVTATGLTSLASVANTANETDTGTAQTVYAGDAITLGETFTTGSAANYNSVLSCANNTTPLTGNVLTINGADTAITCTQTNTRKSATLTLAKTWVNGVDGETATVTSSGFINNASTGLSTSTGNNTTTGGSTSSTVFAGEVGTISEVLTNAANYDATLACTGTSGLVGTTLTIGSTDTSITCTQTNTLKSATFTLRKVWVNAKLNDAVSVTATGLTSFSSVANTANETDTAAAQTVYVTDVITIGETFTTGSSANYTSVLTCTGNATALAGNVLTVSAADTAIVCTQTNTRIVQNLTLEKQWTNGVNGHTATVTTTGGTNNPTVSSTATGGSSSTTGTALTVYAGDVVTLPAETFGGGAIAGDYTSTLACTGGTTLASGAVARNITITSSGTATTCTYTNSRRAQNLTLVKQWTNGVNGHTATVTTTGGTNNPTVSSTATGGSSSTTGTALTVYAGDVVTLPAETFGGGAIAGNYTSTLACTGGTTLASGAVARNITISTSATATICTYTNSRIAQSLTIAKQWTNAVNGHTATVTTTGGTNNPTVSSTSTGNNLTTGTALTVYAGDVVTLPAETFGGGAIAGNYTSTVACTGGTTLASGAVARNITIAGNATATTCTYGNTRISQGITLTKSWTNGKTSDAVSLTITGATGAVAGSAIMGGATTAATATGFAGSTISFAEAFTVGSATNYNSSLSCVKDSDSSVVTVTTNSITMPSDSAVTCTFNNSRLAQNLIIVKQWTNAVNGHTATVATTGSVNSATVNSTATGGSSSTTGTAVAVYAGDVVTLPAETFGGGAIAGNYTSTLACTGGTTLASGAVARNITITTSGTATTCTYTNSIIMPTLTLTKVSNGGVGGFSFTGTNGFGSQTITTLTSGVSVAGTTRTLTTASTSTSITETLPTGYVLMSVSCTGLGSGGTATVNYPTSTVTLDAAATAGAANIACTFTNTVNGTTPSDSLLKTTRFTAVPDIPTIPQGSSGTQTIVMTNNGPDNATNVVTYYRPLVATGVTVTAVSSPAGACVFSSPDWVCPAIASVLNGASYNINVTYSTTAASSLGIAQQGEIRVNSNEYTECGGVKEYKYNVWGLGGNAQPQPAPTNSAFWVGNTNTTTTATPSGAYSSESSDIFQAWPTGQDSPIGSYLYSPVVGQRNNVYSPSSTTANPTVSKVLTGLNGQPENNVLLPQFGSLGTFTGDNKRAWEGQTCVYVPVATTLTPCLAMFDDAAYISVKNLSTGITTVAAGQSNYNPGSVLSGNVSASPGYYIIKARISNRNTNGGNSEDAQGGYGQLAGIGSATCSTAALDSLSQNAVPESINIIAPAKVTITKISQGDVGAFSFSGTNGVANQTITTTVAGVGVAGSPQNLTAVATPTTLTETIPSAYALTDISCTGLGSGGTATPNLVAGTLLLDAAATVSGSDIACTFTNTKRPTLTLTKVSQGGTGTFTFTGDNGWVSQGITTSTSGVGVAGSTQTLTAASTATTITETLASGYTLTGVSCTGMGVGGTVTPNLPAGTFVLDAAATAAGSNISCTVTNTQLANTTVTLIKTSHGGVGTFGYALTNTAQATGTVTTLSAGASVQIDGNTGVLGIQPYTVSTLGVDITINENAMPADWVLSTASCKNSAGATVGSLVGSTYTIPSASVTSGEAFTCNFGNSKSTYSIQGKVFLDNGKGIATPHNGVQEAGELGIGNITMTLTDCAATTYQTVLTDGAGAYSFAVPNSLTTGATLCVEEHQPSTLVSVTGVVGTTAGAYSLASDRTQFTLTASTNYTGINFGDVAESQLTGTGSQTISAGTTANYIHQFIAGTEGVVTLTTAQAPSPSLSGWSSLMYLDATCDAQLNAGDTQITAPISVVADQLLCLIQKVQSPVTATNGAMDISTVSASFVFAAPSVIVRPYSQPDTTIVMDASLVLVKRVREVSSCPSTGADINPFTTNNQALPNALIEYQIMYSNPSASTLSNIAVHDITPAFTEFRSASCTVTPSSLLCATPSSGSGTAPSIGGVGDIDWILTNNPTGLGAGQSGEVRFCVRISP